MNVNTTISGYRTFFLNIWLAATEKMISGWITLESMTRKARALILPGLYNGMPYGLRHHQLIKLQIKKEIK